MAGPGRRWRQLVVWLHVLTSVGWMGQALALLSLLTLGLLTTDPGVRVSALAMAHHLDLSLLALLANGSAFTGFLLAAATPWGYFQHYWVLVKFGITVAQLYLGIFVLSNALDGAAAAAGRSDPPVPLVVGTAAMAGAIAFQGWLSVAKPWGRTPWSAAGRKLPLAGPGTFAAAVLATVADLALAVAMGPLPVFSLVVLGVRLTARRRQVRTVAAAA